MEVGEIIGRHAELEILRGIFSGAAAGRGGGAWIDGEPGIGKSVLMDVALSQARSHGLGVFRAAADRLTELFPLQVITECLRVSRHAADEYRLEIAELRAGRGSGTDAVLAASERVLALVDRETAQSPVVLFIDDIQWADNASLAVWHRLTSAASQAPLVLVCACRPVPHRDEVDHVRQVVTDRLAAPLIRLDALPAADVAVMARSLLSAVPGPGLREALAKAGGNPLYVREMLNALVRDGSVRVAHDVAELDAPSGQPPTSMVAAISRRLDFLARPTRAILRSGALLGTRFSLTDLALLTDHDVPRLVDALSDAVEAGVLVDGDGELTFRHPLIGEVLQSEMPATIRDGVHNHAAKVLAAAGAAWDRVARHLLATSNRPDGWMLDWLAGLPAAALYASPAIAADLLQRARQAIDPDHPLWDLFVARLTTVLRLLHRQDDLVAIGSEALRSTSDPNLVGEVAWNLARTLGMAGQSQQNSSLISQILDRPDLVAPWRSRLRALLASDLLFIDDRDNARTQANLAISEGQACGDPISIGWALVAMTIDADHSAEALELVERGLAVVVGSDMEAMDLRLLLLVNRLVLLVNLYRFDEFAAALPATVALAESAGATTRLLQVQLVAAEQFLVLGDWDQSLLHLDQILEIRHPGSMLRGHAAAALIHVRRGERAEAEALFAAVAHLPYLDGVMRLHAQWLIEAQALLAEADGNPSASTALLTPWLDPQYERRSQFSRPDALMELVRLALSADQRDIAKAAVEAAVADAAASDAPDVSVYADVCRALVSDDPEGLLVAAAFLDGIGWRPRLAFVLQEAAVRLAQQGDSSRARHAFNRAAIIYQDLGAALDLRRLESRLRPFGVRRGSRAARRKATVGWEALTSAELEVARRVAQGQSNPEIATQLVLSRRTVETHVGHILRKLNVRNRFEIATEARRAGLS